jgi:hypothetical protein
MYRDWVDRILVLDAMSPADAVPNVNLTTLARYAVDTRSFQSQVILHGPKKISTRQYNPEDSSERSQLC